MIVAILLLIIISVIIWFLYDYYVHHSRYGRLIDKIPGPKFIPVFGNILKLQIKPDKLWWFKCTTADEYYPILKIWIFHIAAVLIRHPDDLETILNNTKHTEKSMMYDILQPWLNTGLLTSAGAKWHSRRKILTPAFHFNILLKFVDILSEEGKHMTKILKNVGGAVEKDIFKFISEHTLNAICETAMGISLHSLGAAQEEYREKIRQMDDLLAYRVMKPWLLNDFIFTLTSMGRMQQKTLQYLHRFTEKIITERKLYHDRMNGQYLKDTANENKLENDDTEMYGIRKKRLAMLDLLIATSQENHLSDIDIREEVDTFMFAGHHTTATSISFTLLLLAEHKDIQDRVREEVNIVMEQSRGKLTMTSLQNLTYLDKCVKESMRLYTAVHFISRVAAEDLRLQSYIVPSGTLLYLNISSLHRDANFWPNPDVFDPDRFLPEKIQNRHPYSYLPFSAGPRNCIGQRFAMLEMKAMIAHLVHNFYLEPVDYLKNMQLMSNVLLRSKNPMHVKFVPIETA